MWRFLCLLVLAASPATAGSFTVQETGQSYFTLSAAVFAVGDGVGTILIAPGRYLDCAVQESGIITYRAEKPLTAIFDGEPCEGKAVLVLRGQGATVEGLVFENLRVPDGNGAGIRLEKGSLEVQGSTFRDSDEGILTGDDPEEEIRVERSTFMRLGRCDRGLSCAHSIYVGAFRSLTVRECRFEEGSGGHYVKSRSPWITVVDSSFDDSHGRTTNYMVDLPEGARGRIENNIFVQGANKENRSAFIAVAAEGRRNSSDGLTIARNIVAKVPEAMWGMALVSDWSASPKNIADNRIAEGIEEMKAIDATSDLGLISTAIYYVKSFIKHILGLGH